MRGKLNYFILGMISLVLFIWIYSMDKRSSEIDHLMYAINNGTVIEQPDTNRVKLCYQLQFLYAPKILEFMLPAEKPFEVHYNIDNVWHVLQFKTVQQK
jgi:hypothetical protein